MYKKICIPRIEVNYKYEDIVNIFERFKIGKIKNINFIKNQKSETDVNTAFIYMDEWFSNEKVKTIFARFSEGHDIKLVHKPPQYLKIVLMK